MSYSVISVSYSVISVISVSYSVISVSYSVISVSYSVISFSCVSVLQAQENSEDLGSCPICTRQLGKEINEVSLHTCF